ncbi:hypothetical protein LF1_59160 [Rubripirellula obstinata]|uniref:Uncharacterized protein n=1 Tax=Rubripirellula obstinata TaxID=406547 RepID=A0A5B1C6T9_9BACT|nr:hypothetical protein LF1_59160 [Rubripirellula obstinata]
MSKTYLLSAIMFTLVTATYEAVSRNASVAKGLRLRSNLPTMMARKGQNQSSSANLTFTAKG